MPADTIYRLEDMEVDEVSLVDRPANKRPFLVVKRSTEMGAELTPDGRGGFTSATPTTPTVKLELPKGMKEGLAKELESLAAMAGEIGKLVGKAKEVEVDEGSLQVGLPQELTEKVDELKGLWSSVQDLLKPPAPEKPASDGEEDAPAMPGAAPAPQSPAPTEMMLRDAALKTELEKIGRKMSKGRLERFKQALSVLFSIMNELAGEEAAPEQPAGAPQTTEPRGVEDVVARDPAAKQDDDGATAMIVELTKTVQSLAAQNAQQEQRIATLGKTRRAGNAVAVDSTPQERTEAMSWPLDMNNPVDRDTVSKQEYFE
jgi:hypothetical protein